MLTSIESNDWFILKQRVHFWLYLHQLIFQRIIRFCKGFNSYLRGNIELFCDLIHHLFLVWSESKQPHKLYGVLPVVVEIFILSCHDKRKTFVGTLQPDSEIKERNVQAHKFFKSVIQISLNVKWMKETQKFSRPLILS